ncbi:hypothetical protein WJX84_001219 [Apatococcus fuscideae]|uniref:DNA repair protein RAD50 n=1 Tax=Apatococcus fuscideae TaxID=2026836 RepID=A0AAW1TB67_9CHLO
MCTLDKMLIKGIRSFSPDNLNVIEFYKPLTLIVGQNGAGKTTVIECLKQACTGSLPPNTRSGQSFIHDPKVAGETEVKALIKLRFRTYREEPIVVIRTFQLTQKKLALQYKALDNTLQTFNRDTGAKEALAYRCADIDRHIPVLMGVSQAVLENVIFVHQEESNWPLADTQTLKKKFDEIFSVEKYTKALEALAKLKKEKAQEAKELRLKLENLRTHRDAAQKLRADVSHGTARDAEHMQKIQDFEDQMQSCGSSLEELESKLGRINQLSMECQQLDTKQRTMLDHNAQTLANLQRNYPGQEMDMGLEELEAEQGTLVNDQDQLQTEIRQLERQMQATRIHADAVLDTYQKDLTAQAKLQADSDRNSQATIERDRFLRRLAAQYTLGQLSDNGTLEASAVGVATRSFDSKAATAESELQSLKDSHRREDRELGATVDRITADINAAKEGMRVNSDVQRRNESNVSNLEMQIGRCQVSPAILEETKDRQQQSSERLKTAKANQDKAKLQQDLTGLNRELNELQDKVSNLRQERDGLSTAAEGATRLRIKRQELLHKEEALTSLVTSRRTKLQAFLGIPAGTDLPSNQRLKAASLTALSRKRAALKQKSDAMQAKRNDAAASSSLLSNAKRDLQSKELEASRLQGDLVEGILQAFGQEAHSQELPEATQLTEKDRTEASEKLQKVNAMEILLDHSLRHARSKKCCQTCARPLNPNEMQTFNQKIERDKSSIPANRNNLESMLASTEQRLSQLRQLQPAHIRWEALRDKHLPEARRQISELQRTAEAQTAVVGELQEELEEAESQLQEGETIQQEASLRSSSNARTVADVDSELDTLETDKRNIEMRKDSLLQKQNRLRDAVAAATDELHKVQQELTSQEGFMRQKEGLQEQAANLRRHNEQLGGQIGQHKNRMQPLEAERQQHARERQTKQKNAADAERTAEGRLLELRDASSKLHSMNNALSDYASQKKEAQLEKLTKALESAKERRSKAETTLHDLGKQKKEKEDRHREHASIRRQLEDTAGYLRSVAAQEALAVKADKLHKQMDEVGRLDEVTAEFVAVQSEMEELRRRQNMLKGALGHIRDAVRNAERELSAHTYVGIDSKYRKQLIELRTTEMAGNDLEKYHKALEKALLTFHTNKMADINKTIKELWQKTYRGQDIDYCKIAADTEGGKRSYNYRVVMVSAGADLEMRGRCSAGQKVLACLIIRLALAETFCLSCGILALDEPTTNLDAANAESLAGALRSIMDSRRDQQNFQLIVITHDERFAHLIGTRDHAEYMWRITKDENQHSHVAQEDVVG